MFQTFERQVSTRPMNCPLLQHEEHMRAMQLLVLTMMMMMKTTMTMMMMTTESENLY
jgi:hypothetical protein